MRLPFPPAPRPSAEFDLRKLYTEHGTYVQSLVSRLLGPGIDPQDLTQEVFLMALRKAPDDLVSPRAWIASLTFALAANFRRTRWFRERNEASTRAAGLAESADWYTPETALEDRQKMELLYRCIDRLARKKREVLISVDIQGISVQEFAETLGSSEKTIYSRLTGARHDLQTLIRRMGRAQ